MRPYIYLCFLHFCFSLCGQVRLNEVSNHNEHTVTDGDGDTPDWLEVWIASGLNKKMEAALFKCYSRYFFTYFIEWERLSKYI